MSSLRRSADRCRHVIQYCNRRHIRSFSGPPSVLIASSIGSTDPNGSRKHPSLLKWISAIAVGTGVGVSLYLCSPSTNSTTYPVKSLMVVADWLTAAADRINKLYDNHPISSSNFLIRDALRRRIFFNYEKRLRTLSPPEKVFEYFASFRNTGGETFMTPGDLMRAIVPVFPPSESNLVRDGSLRGERFPGELRCDRSEFFMLFDVNNDGLISFKEYIFFVTLLSIPESSFSVAFKMFDIDSNGGIDREEFKKVMALMRAHNRQGALHRDGLRAGPRVGGDVENGGLVEYFFGEDGNKRLRHDKFVQFLRDLHNEMIRLEFSHYDFKSCGTISAKDFALSMVASGDIRHLRRLLDRVDELDDEPHLKDIRITFEEFKNFSELRKRLQPFSLALFSYGQVNGLLTRKDFQRAASHVCGVSLSDNVIELVFHLFDANQDGHLCSDEFVRVMQRREREIAQPIDAAILNVY